MNAPAGGRQMPGRYIGNGSRMTPVQIYRQVREYRQLYPDKAIIHNLDADQVQTMAFLMAGGSLLTRGMASVREYPAEYEMPLGCENILTIYEFIRDHLVSGLPRMRPLDAVKHDGAWCLGEPGNMYLIYMPTGVPFRLDLADAPGAFEARWVGMKLGTVFEAFGGTLEGGKVHDLRGLDWRQWMLWLKKRA